MTEYRKRVKKALIDHERTQKWLVEEIAERTGLYFDTAYLSRILNEKNKNPKILAAIQEILHIS